MTETIRASIYDYPRYYDLVFGSDWKAECDFLQACFDRFATGTVRRVFEPACGTGRLMFRLAKAGYDVSGLDLNERAVEFCNERLARHGFARSAFVADMTDFRVRRKVDAAFNTINSFRHLLSERAARAHLQCVAEALRKGGLYLLGIHLTPTRGRPSSEESWSARRGNLAVNTQMWELDRDPIERIERFAMQFDVYTPTRHMRLDDELVLRAYSMTQFQQLVDSVPSLRIVETYDFHYEIDQPIEVSETVEDVVYVLKKV
ncbi:MAG: class I SAM-dependent methyltransferase [Planctomycetales bacterium]|nr:class I SAM-dependent methyltransferase [Planctomycetales bacterium]